MTMRREAYLTGVYPACPMKSEGHFIGVKLILITAKRI